MSGPIMKPLSTSLASSPSTVLGSARAYWRLLQVNDDSGMTSMLGWKPKVKSWLRKWTNWQSGWCFREDFKAVMFMEVLD